jgi:hypothetical protein
MRSLVLEAWSSSCLEAARDPVLVGCGGLCGFDGRVTRFGAKPKGGGKSPAATFAFLLRTDQGAGKRACPPKSSAAGSRSGGGGKNPVRGSLPGVSRIFRAERKAWAESTCARGTERPSRCFVLGALRWSDQKRNAGMVQAARSAALAVGAISEVAGNRRSSRGWQRCRGSVTRGSSKTPDYCLTWRWLYRSIAMQNLRQSRHLPPLLRTQSASAYNLVVSAYRQSTTRTEAQCLCCSCMPIGVGKLNL